MMKIGRRGSINIILTVRGIQGHVAYPHLVDNPIHRLGRMIEALAAEPFDKGSTHFQPSALQFTTVDVGNPTENLVPGKVEARFNIRFNDRWTSATLLDEVRRRLAAAHTAIGGHGTWDVTWRVSGESFYTPPGELSKLLGESVREVTGLDPELSTTGGTSDARFIRAYCPVVEFGNVGETMHKVDERSSVADVAALSRIYERLLDRFFDA
jgi:succinyl-diaminopimelate desuccinylase